MEPLERALGAVWESKKKWRQNKDKSLLLPPILAILVSLYVPRFMFSLSLFCGVIKSPQSSSIKRQHYFSFGGTKRRYEYAVPYVSLAGHANPIHPVICRLAPPSSESWVERLFIGPSPSGPIGHPRTLEGYPTWTNITRVTDYCSYLGERGKRRVRLGPFPSVEDGSRVGQNTQM